MDQEEIIKAIRAYNIRLRETIEGNVSRFEGEVVDMQEALLQTMLSDYLSKMETVNGVIMNTPNNYRRLAGFDKAFARFDDLYQKNRLRKFAGELLQLSKFSLQYYGQVGYGPDVLEKIRGAVDRVEDFIGIKDNKLVTGGYLDSLGQSHEVKLKMKNYVLNSISTKKGYRQFLKGFREMVVGPNKATDGVLQRYYRVYAYDKFNQVREVANQYAADEIGLRYFIYEGSLIATSRKFCEKRAGKVFSTAEALTWKNDPDLIEKKTKESYNPLIERGRYNCRHFISYISDELAAELRPDLKN